MGVFLTNPSKLAMQGGLYNQSASWSNGSYSQLPGYGLTVGDSVITFNNFDFKFDRAYIVSHLGGNVIINFKSTATIKFEFVDAGSGRIQVNIGVTLTVSDGGTYYMAYMIDNPGDYYQTEIDYVAILIFKEEKKIMAVWGYHNRYGAGTQSTILSEISEPLWTNIFADSTVSDDPYGTLENSTPSGGYGSFNYDGDDVDIPVLPTLSAASCGFVGLYNPTAAELKALADYMWTGLLDLSTYKKIFGDPMDCILSVGIIPVTPARSDTKEALDFGNFLSTGVTAYKITSQFAEVDCGSVTVNGASASAMDYAPFTKAELFLPFCGTHSLAVDEIMDSTLTVKYHIDLYTGACVAYVKVTFPADGRSNSDGSKLDSVMYQFTGNVLATIPVTSANHAQFIQSVLFAAAATAATVANGGAAAAEAAKAGEAYGIVSEGGAAISAGSAIKSVMATKPDIMKSGNLTANAGFLGLKKPVLTLTQPNLCRPADEYKLAGMPKQASGTLSDFEGFTIVSACHMDNILCTDTEREMILKALCEGVIV